MSRALALSLAALCAGCGVPLEAPLGLAPVNTCSNDSDCAQGAACTAGGLCAATSFDLTGMLVEVRPEGAAVFGEGLSFMADPTAAGIPLVSPGSGARPFFDAFDIDLPAPLVLRGTVVPDTSTDLGGGCVLPMDHSLPASVTFYRLPRLSSLAFDPVKVSTALVEVQIQGQDEKSNAFDVQLVSDPADRYDVYIEPAQVMGCPTFPPYFLPNQVMLSTSTVWMLPPTGALSGNIAGLTDLATWEVAVVEPSRGLPISAAGSLLLVVGDNGAAVSASISPVAAGLWPIIRLTPIAPTQADPHAVDPTRATVYWSLQGAIASGTTANPDVQLGVDDVASSPVTVTAQIVGSNMLDPTPSALTIQSGSLNGVDASNAAYSNDTVFTDDKGNFTVELPSGSYTIRAIPLVDNGLSITDIPLTWPASMPTSTCVCGKAFPLDAKPELIGTISTPTGQPLATTAVGVSPTQTPPLSYLANTHTLPPLPARSESTTTDDSGSFQLFVDRGTADLTVQPDPGTNLPWLVVPQFSPAASTASSPLALTTPAFLGGTVRDPQGMPVANAQIDVWFPVRDPTNPGVLTGAVVKIATTTTDENGAYTLVLPSSI